jgi:NAD(P)-dependent dehydrogenase (short-subunit alcohol dehydrogenase family)
MPDLPGMFDLSERVAVVTGGAGLLGAEFCRTLAEAGAGVVVADTNRESADALVGLISRDGGKAMDVFTDVSDKDSVHELISATLKAYGRLDILVNSAAMDPKFDPEHAKAHASSFEEYPLTAWRQALDVNLTGMFLCCQAAVHPMLENQRGVIINVCSIYGMVAPDQRIYRREGQPQQFKPAYYSVTKAGILGLTRYLAAYYTGQNIRVNALTPGGVYNDHDREFVTAYSARAILGRMAEKDEMNGALLFLASDASSYMTGSNLVVDGGWTAW